MRPLASEERSVIERLAEKLDSATKQQLLKDLHGAEAEDAVEDKSRVVLHIQGYQRPRYEGQRPFPVDGTLIDADGTQVDVLLYRDQNDRLLELELVRCGEGNLISPDWATFKVT